MTYRMMGVIVITITTMLFPNFNIPLFQYFVAEAKMLSQAKNMSYYSKS